MNDILINYINKIDPQLLYKEFDYKNNKIICISKNKENKLEFKSIKELMNYNEFFYYEIKINDLLLLIDVEELLNII